MDATIMDEFFILWMKSGKQCHEFQICVNENWIMMNEK
jgi:hypothetical protein